MITVIFAQSNGVILPTYKLSQLKFLISANQRQLNNPLQVHTAALMAHNGFKRVLCQSTLPFRKNHQ
jgi:hypothetical protein